MENACDIRQCGLSYVYLHDAVAAVIAAAATSAESQLILYHLDIYVNLKKQMFEKYTASIWYFVYLYTYNVCDGTLLSLAAVNHFQLCAKYSILLVLRELFHYFSFSRSLARFLSFSVSISYFEPKICVRNYIFERTKKLFINYSAYHILVVPGYARMCTRSHIKTAYLFKL